MAEKWEPLTESYYYILLCLKKRPNHGYGIMQSVLEMTDMQLRIGSGTMYGATSNMMKKGWIEEIETRNEQEERKRMYQITALGNRVLLEEVKRLSRMLVHAKGIDQWEDI